ncbi:FAD:protein FMN transferase [Pseudoclostridium thermosuccinogenes]|uniref:FAD:protein FMN transferase n=1 Tax=Clostridium thermosuccinogenes TaxID=84032 RepID=UPI002FD95FFC
MRRKILLLLMIYVSFILASCQQNTPAERIGTYMGTVITEKVYGKNAQKAADEVMEKIAELEAMMTIKDADKQSEIDKLNDMAGVGEVKLSRDSISVLGKAIEYAELSEGAFDVTIGPLANAWGIFTDNPRVPSKDEIDKLKSLVNYRDISINNADSSAYLARKGQIVDLGGIAKGYAGDVAVEILKAKGVKSALINLGGNVVALGSKPDGNPWSIGIQNPRAPTGEYIGIVKVRDKAVVSSGDYERFFEKDGVRYHHILDPRTGYPADSGLIATTIVADSSTDADALSTSVFVLGLEKGMQLVERLDGVDAIFITEDKKVYITEGLKESFTFKDESKEFTYVEER